MRQTARFDLVSLAHRDPNSRGRKCWSFRTWMFFCCETLIMVLITTLAVLYIAHFTGKLAEGGAEVWQQRQYANSHHHRGGAHQAPHTSPTNLSDRVDRAGPPWKAQLDRMVAQLEEYLTRHHSVADGLQQVAVGKVLTASTQLGVWSNVFYVRINFEVDNGTSRTNTPPPGSRVTRRH